MEFFTSSKNMKNKDFTQQLENDNTNLTLRKWSLKRTHETEFGFDKFDSEVAFLSCLQPEIELPNKPHMPHVQTIRCE